MFPYVKIHLKLDIKANNLYKTYHLSCQNQCLPGSSKFPKVHWSLSQLLPMSGPSHVLNTAAVASKDSSRQRQTVTFLRRADVFMHNTCHTFTWDENCGGSHSQSNRFEIIERCFHILEPKLSLFVSRESFQFKKKNLILPFSFRSQMKVIWSWR